MYCVYYIGLEDCFVEGYSFGRTEQDVESSIAIELRRSFRRQRLVRDYRLLLARRRILHCNRTASIVSQAKVICGPALATVESLTAQKISFTGLWNPPAEVEV